MADKWHVDENKIWFRPESGWPEDVPKNIDFPLISLGDMLEETVEKYPDHKAVWFLDSFMTYRELNGHVNALATAFHNLGFKKGDVIAFLLPNSFQYVVCYYACQKLGVIASGMNPTYKPMELLHQLKTTGAAGLVVLDSLYEESIAPIIKDSPVKTIVVTNIADHLPFLKQTLGKLLKKIPTGATPSGALQYTALLKSAPNVPRAAIDPEEDAATFIMTGGTTGLPKAAVLTHFNLVSNSVQCKAWLTKLGPGSCAVGVLPLFHSFAMTVVMNAIIRVGGWMMLFPRPPDTGETLDAIARIGVDDGTIYAGAEILFKRIADLEDFDAHDPKGKISLCVSGAGPLHRPVQEAFEERTGGKLVEGYGLTEASPVVSAGPFWGKRKAGTIGLPFPGTEWRILDAETATKDLGVGEDAVGEICVAGPQIMKGYLNQPGETADHLVQFEGKTYLRTGDIGFMDEDGQITIKDRKKQLIKFRGYSVFPKEVEELVGGHEAVSEVAVAGIPDEDAGEIIKAWVVLKDSRKGKISEEELKVWCKKNMTHYKVPRAVEFRDDLPKSLVGKVMRRTLQEEDPVYRKAKGME